VAIVSGFGALRYDTAIAGPLATLVAPPYDVIDAEARTLLRAQSPFNIVRLTLPEAAEDAGGTLRDWRDRGVLVEDEPALWWIAQDYVGPDGVPRMREGIAGSIEATPYAKGEVMPHERTHRAAKDGRLRILRATRTELEPIFLLYDADPLLERPEGMPTMDVELGGERTRVWRLDETELEIGVPLLIADGHHRYETAVTFRREQPAAHRTFAVLVSSRSPGLEIFPTHRIVGSVGVEPAGALVPNWDAASLGLYRDGAFFRLASDDELDAREVERYQPHDVDYTPDAVEAVTAVDDGRAELAFLVRPPTVAQVFAWAQRGEIMPQKSTFFYPKLTSGLLLHPV
jgi:uncharacterized protein (DUF1015 family)